MTTRPVARWALWARAWSMASPWYLAPVPDAQFVNAGSWAGGIAIAAINADLVEGETIDYIAFPGDEAGEGAIVASADVAVMFNDSEATAGLMSFLMSAEGQALFAPSGYTVANKHVDAGLYSGLTARTAELLATSAIGPDINSPLPNEVVNALMEAVGGGHSGSGQHRIGAGRSASRRQRLAPAWGLSAFAQRNLSL